MYSKTRLLFHPQRNFEKAKKKKKKKKKKKLKGGGGRGRLDRNNGSEGARKEMIFRELSDNPRI